jgi:uncharacterized protein YfaS (alpha-2-macroglobulin family)
MNIRSEIAGIIALLSGIIIADAVVAQKTPATAKTSASTPTIRHESNDARWHIIDSLINIGLTESAMKEADTLYQKAKKDNEANQQVKSLMYYLRLESYKEEEAVIKAVNRLEQDTKDAAMPLSAILHSMTAEVYWRYYEQNRWRFYDRTRTAQFKQDDIRTWDLSKIVDATMRHYGQSLAEQERLRKIPLSRFGDILVDTGRCGDRRPTLYDFLAHRAIDFFMNTETDLPQPSYVFQLDKAGYLKKWDGFAVMTLSTRDTLSLKFRALVLLQDLIAFHKGDGNLDALVDADLKRLRFVHDHSTVDSKDSLYLAALESLLKKCEGRPVAAECMHEIALAYVEKAGRYRPGTAEQYKWFNKKALELCDLANKKYPESYGACQCAVLKKQILAKSIQVQVEEVSVPDKPQRCLVSWKNLGKAWFRAVPLDIDELNRMMEKFGYYEQEKLFDWLRGIRPAAQWDCAIPDDGDCQGHSAEIKVPALAPGFYAFLASADADFKYPGNGIALGRMWISRIAYYTRSVRNGNFEMYVRDRESGAALAKAAVKKLERIYDEKQRRYKHELKGTYTTDAEGKVVLPSPFLGQVFHANPFFLEIVAGKDRLRTEREYYQYRSPDQTNSRMETFFFTDRSIYRPGQTVYFKAIVLKRSGDRTEIVPRQKSSVLFLDVNYQKVSSLALTTNEYGTMSGSFTAPSGVLNGQMQIKNEWGSTYFSVEEYKRPKFEVTANPVKGQFRLNEMITVTGQARTYAGSAVDGGRVKYRVVRSTSYPYWFGWWRFWCPPSPEMEITNGSTVSNDTGGFSATFKAIPDPSVARTYDPTFEYTVYFDVTDPGGETRSCQAGVSVGYTALSLSVDIRQLVDKSSDTAFAIKAENRSGNPEAAAGMIRIFRLKAPETALRNRLWAKPDKYTMDKKEYTAVFPGIPYADENLVTSWPRDKKVFDKSFDTKTDTQLKLREMREWQQGVYVLEATAKDAFGQEVKSTQYFTLYSSNESSLASPLCDWFVGVKESGEPGEKAAFLIGTAEKDVQVLFEVEHKSAIIKKEWLRISKSQKLVEIPIEEKFRGNFCVHFMFIRNGRVYRHSATVSVPWTNKQLQFSFESFRSKLLPGQKEEWRIKITGKKSEKVAAEMVAAMYDASLDAFRGHGWNFSIDPWYSMQLAWDAGQFGAERSRLFSDGWNSYGSCSSIVYPFLNWFGYNAGYYGGRSYRNKARRSMTSDGGDGDGDPVYCLKAAPAPPSAPAPVVMAEKEMSAGTGKKGVAGIGYGEGYGSGFGGGEPVRSDKPKVSVQELSAVKARTNLNETAFFFPHLLTNEKGEVIVSFTMPEALTRWKMLGFAHTKDLKYGMVSKDLVTQKQLMVMPNLPRFLRENDRITLAAKVTNLSENDLAGSAQLMLFDATTGKPADTALGNVASVKNITVKKGLSAALGWDIKIPEGVPAVTVRIVAKAGDFSDGEESILPLLVNRMLVTETMPLPMRGKGTKKFTFEKLLSQASKSTTLRNHKLTLEFTQNPAWYAVQALPYLMEFPHECAEQTFARFYANTIATNIANSTPKIKAVFDTWRTKNPGALVSNLLKNQELKSALVEETPWVLDGKDESESKKRIGLLFDLNHMSHELGAAQRRLEKMQMSNGGWPWFDGMPDDRYITQYIITGFGRLQNLGMANTAADRSLREMVERGVRYCDDRIREDYDEIMAHAIYPDSNHLGYTQIQYLYMRTFFKDIAIDPDNQKAHDYFKGQAIKYWLRNSRYMQAMIALALSRMAVKDLPRHIIRSMKENSLSSEEMGMYWKEMYEGFHWYEAPIEAQALYIEAFDEVARDTASVEAMKVWLLKSKQTQNWKSTRATAEACYALLLRGASLLANQNDVTITLGKLLVDPTKLKDADVEAGTGYFKTSWSGSDIKPEMGGVTVAKASSGVAWGALYWQYFEQLDKITFAKTPLKLDRKLFVKRNTDRGPVLDPVTEKSAVKIGDKITVRIELRVDRDMEYVHLKDMRSAGFEPLDVISGYRWQDGLGYYQSTRDVATHFFFSYLNKGTYVFEYELVVSHKGDFSNGITTIQCMYAPEFSSHSEGIRVKVLE